MKQRIIFALTLLMISLTACRQHHSELLVMTYNVRHCAGMDLVVDYDRTAKVIRQQQPDVVALQELDSMTGRSGHCYQLGELARRTGYESVFGPAIDYDGGKYGVGILVNETPLSTKCIPLPGEEDRVLLVVELKDYVMACTHLDLEEEARLASLPLIVEEARRWQKPFVLAGDWNDSPDSALLQKLMQSFILLSLPAPSYPADDPQECLDYIAVYRGRPANGLESLVIEEPEASDHRPVVMRALMR